MELVVTSQTRQTNKNTVALTITYATYIPQAVYLIFPRQNSISGYRVTETSLVALCPALQTNRPHKQN